MDGFTEGAYQGKTLKSTGTVDRLVPPAPAGSFPPAFGDEVEGRDEDEGHDGGEGEAEFAIGDDKFTFVSLDRSSRVVNIRRQSDKKVFSVPRLE